MRAGANKSAYLFIVQSSDYSREYQKRVLQKNLNSNQLFQCVLRPNGRIDKRVKSNPQKDLASKNNTEKSINR